MYGTYPACLPKGPSKGDQNKSPDVVLWESLPIHGLLPRFNGVVWLYEIGMKRLLGDLVVCRKLLLNSVPHQKDISK